MRLVSRLKLLFIIGCIGCGSEDNTIDGFTPEEWAKISEHSPFPAPPADRTNRVADDPEAAELGQSLFFDKRWSGPITFDATAEEGAVGAVGEEGKASCVTCHQPEAAFADMRSNPNETSLGTGGWTGRNSMTMVNAVYYDWSGWTGFIDTFWAHCFLGIESGRASNGDRLRLAHLLYDKYRDQYNAIFDPDLDPALDPAHPDAARFPPIGKPKLMPTDPDGPWEMMTPDDQAHVTLIMVNSGKAMNAYLRRIVTGETPFDRYVAGDHEAISPAAKRGLKLFVGKAACAECHSGPFFADQKFHNLGVPQVGLHVAPEDLGRKTGVETILGRLAMWNSEGPYSDDTSGTRLDGLMALDEDIGKFRTPSLRNVTETPPYMHTGQFATLRDVVVFYDDGGDTEGFMGTKDSLMKPLNLTDQEIDDIVAFLETLTSPLPADVLVDTSAP